MEDNNISTTIAVGDNEAEADIDLQFSTNNSDNKVPDLERCNSIEDKMKALSITSSRKIKNVIKNESGIKKKNHKRKIKRSNETCVDILNQINASLQRINNTLTNIKTSLDNSFRNLEGITNRSLSTSAAYYNQLIPKNSSGSVVRFKLNETLPVDIALPKITSKNDILNLTREQIEQYLMRYGVAFTEHSTTYAMRTDLLEMLGYN
jgi:hypothetical protein